MEYYRKGNKTYEKMYIAKTKKELHDFIGPLSLENPNDNIHTFYFFVDDTYFKTNKTSFDQLKTHYIQVGNHVLGLGIGFT